MSLTSHERAMQLLAERDALKARLAEAERLLDSGMIRLIQRDEFGQVGFHLIKGIDLRACIAEAIESERPVETQPGSPHFDGAATYDRATDSASAVQPERCCLDYPRCDCNSPPEPDNAPAVTGLTQQDYDALVRDAMLWRARSPTGAGGNARAFMCCEGVGQHAPGCIAQEAAI